MDILTDIHTYEHSTHHPTWAYPNMGIQLTHTHPYGQTNHLFPPIWKFHATIFDFSAVVRDFMFLSRGRFRLRDLYPINYSIIQLFNFKLSGLRLLFSIIKFYFYFSYLALFCYLKIYYSDFPNIRASIFTYKLNHLIN